VPPDGQGANVGHATRFEQVELRFRAKTKQVRDVVVTDFAKRAQLIDNTPLICSIVRPNGLLETGSRFLNRRDDFIELAWGGPL
jgi:hypothetical protein